MYVANAGIADISCTRICIYPGFFFFSHRRSVKNPRTRASRAPSRGKWPGALRRGSLRQVVNRRPGLAPAEAIDVVVVPAAIFWLGVPKFGIQTTRTLQKKSSISAESSRRDTSKSEVFSVLGALACTHDLLKVRPKCHYGIFFAQNFSLAKVITLANLTMHMYEV